MLQRMEIRAGAASWELFSADRLMRLAEGAEETSRTDATLKNFY
jgi:hypothetical protein